VCDIFVAVTPSERDCCHIFPLTWFVIEFSSEMSQFTSRNRAVYMHRTTCYVLMDFI